MARPYNFSAGPAALPESVLARAQEEFLDWAGNGYSVMEASHRSAGFLAVAERAENDLRALLSIPSNYRVLFMQGGATLQFAAVPMNLSVHGDSADYVVTGSWGKKAIKEAARYLTANVAADEAGSNYTAVPAQSTWQRSPNAAFLHYTPNETIGGVEFHEIPDSDGVPLVADMSSTILSRPIDVQRFGLIYAGAQKNIGPAGLTLVIVRDDLLGRSRPDTPSVLNYQAVAESDSMLNTPPTFAWYIAGLVFSWLRAQGGLEAIAEQNRVKATALYDAIDSSSFYRNPVNPPDRSWMNIPFTLAQSELDGVFLKEAAVDGLVNLKGHRSVGGMRASIYNAMPQAGVDALVDFMGDFERRHG
jgi:phosphoserine aminotransferase